MKDYIKEIIHLFAHNDYSSSTTKKLGQWLADEEGHARKEEVLQELWEEVRHSEMPERMNESIRAMHRNTGIRLGNKTGRLVARDRKRAIFSVWQAAAVLFFALSSVSVYWILTQRPTPADVIESYIPRTEIREITLPDGTRVKLNSESSLLYPKTFDGTTRSVYLVGEANFCVTPDQRHPFIVKSNGFQVTALGTEFQVTAYPDEEEVSATLLSGSVRVEYNDLTDSSILKPNEKLIYNKQSKEHRLIQPNMADETAWQRGILVFSCMDIEDILTQLERKYPYSFVYSLNSMKRNTYSFRFVPNSTIDEVMTIITKVMEMDYKIVGNKCYLMQK